VNASSARLGDSQSWTLNPGDLLYPERVDRAALDQLLFDLGEASTTPRSSNGKVEASIVRYLATLDRADRDESDVAEARTTRIKDKIARLRQQMQAVDEGEGA
jgi:hypothetical protein